MITLHVIVTITTTVSLITKGEGFRSAKLITQYANSPLGAVHILRNQFLADSKPPSSLRNQVYSSGICYNNMSVII